MSLNSEDYKGFIGTPIRKTQVVTLYMRQLQMQNFYNSVKIPAEDDPNGQPAPGPNTYKTAYIGLARTSPWTDSEDPDISDTFPPIPDPHMTELDQLVGLGKCTWKRYAKPYVAPTTEQKDAAGTVYYKGLYYETTTDLEYALANDFTAVLFLMVADAHQYFATDVQVRQVGLFMDVNRNNALLNPDDWAAMSVEDRGHLVAVQNMMPITRQDTQLEKYYFLIQF